MQTKLKRWPKVVSILQSFARAYFCIMIVVLLLQCFDAASNHRVPVSLNLAESTQQSMTGSINQSTDSITLYQVHQCHHMVSKSSLSGIALWGIGQTGVFFESEAEELGLLETFLFGSLIAAVDPVAVLAVFDEIKVSPP